MGIPSKRYFKLGFEDVLKAEINNSPRKNALINKITNRTVMLTFKITHTIKCVSSE